MIENVLKEEIEIVELVFSNKKKSGGGPYCNKKIPSFDNNCLILFYEDAITASRVLSKNDGAVEHNGKVYRAKKVKNSKENDLLEKSIKLKHK